MSNKLRVRILLRVSSIGQLDADGDLKIQRNLVLNYIEANQSKGWHYDASNPENEYYEGGISGFKNSVAQRSILQQIMQDAKENKFDILVCYKDDRLGRRSHEIPLYIQNLANYGVTVFTVKDGCLTPKNRTEELINSIRYWHAEGSSIDTIQRVRDAAIENVKKGRNMGGKAPYGYTLEYSGELSKHQRALKKKVKVPKQVDVVLKIYDLAITKGYGAYKIAKLLNATSSYRDLSPNGNNWNTSTVADILKNPIYTGYEAYNRRSHTGQAFTRLDRSEWILSEVCNPDLKIMETAYWEKAQSIRESRKTTYTNHILKPVQDNSPSKQLTETSFSHSTSQATTATYFSSGKLPLIDVAHCAYCGKKLTNGSKYHYWTTKDGVRHKSLSRYYRCQGLYTHLPDNDTAPSTSSCYRCISAKALETIVYRFCKTVLQDLEDNSFIHKALQDKQNHQYSTTLKKLHTLEQKLVTLERDFLTLQDFLPKVLTGELPLSLDQFQEQLQRIAHKKETTQAEIQALRNLLSSSFDYANALSTLSLPSWEWVFDQADFATKRMLINKICDRIEISKTNVTIYSRLVRETTANP